MTDAGRRWEDASVTPLPRRPARARPALGVLAAVVLAASLAVASPVSAQSDPSPDPTLAPLESDLPLGDIIPRPNSGRAPDSPNDPGGWQQYMVLGLIVAGVALIIVLVARESRRSRPRAGSR